MRDYRLSAVLLVSALVGCTGLEDPPPPPETETEITFNLLPANSATSGELRVAFVAYQEGADGEWKPMPGQGGVRKVTITSERFGLALACVGVPNGFGEASSLISVSYSTVAEAKEVRNESCFIPETPAATTSPITVSGLGANESVRFEYGLSNRREVVANGANELSGPRGTSSAMALVFSSPPPRPINALPLRVLRLPDISLPGSVPLAIDVSGGQAPVSMPVTVPAGLRISDLRTMVLNTDDTFIARIIGTPTRAMSVPASQLRPGDAIRFVATIDDGPNDMRTSISYLSEPGPVTIEALAPLSVVAPTLPAAGKRLFAITLPALNGTLRYADTRIALRVNGEIRVGHDVTMSRGWRGDSSLSYTFPDFSGIAGYVPDVSLPPSVQVDWEVVRNDYNQHELTVGRKFLSSIRNGIIMP